jgi:hypothetical protein
MMNDYISILSANVIDLSVEISVVLDSSQNQGVVVTNIINKISDYFNPSNMELGKNVYVSELKRMVQEENGVISITDLSIFNMVGGQYSSSQTSMSYADTTTRQIQPVDETIFAQPNQIYQVRFPNKDIKVKVKNLSTVNFS